MKGIVKLANLSLSMQSDIENYLVENAGATDIPDKMPVEKVLQAYLEWNGIIGFTAQIIRIIEEGQND